MDASLSTSCRPWPDHDDFSSQFAKLVRALRHVDASVAECLASVGRIAQGNGADWYREWKIQGDASKARADAAFAQGFHQTAASGWLQAAAFYGSARAFLPSDDVRSGDLLSAAENCANLYMRCLRPAGEIVDMRCGRRRVIRSYFLRAPDASRRSSVVICFGGPGETRDELLGRMTRFARASGLSLMIVDPPGGRRAGGSNRPCRRIEIAVDRCMDYLSKRGDVDPTRIALFGDNFGAVYASRVAAVDHRFAAVVCDGGIWDENGRRLLSSWAIGSPAVSMSRYVTARQLKCPFLVTSADYEFLDREAVRGLHEYSIKEGLQMELRLFSAEDAGPTRRAFIFDWLATKIAGETPEGTADEPPDLPGDRRSAKGARENSVST